VPLLFAGPRPPPNGIAQPERQDNTGLYWIERGKERPNQESKTEQCTLQAEMPKFISGKITPLRFLEQLVIWGGTSI